jgi:translation initiation factor IF-2
MSEGKTMRLNKVLRELNISLDRAVEFLEKNGHDVEARPTAKISGDVYQVLLDGFQTDASKKAASKEVGEEKRKEKEAIRLEHEAKLEKKRAEEEKKEEVVLKAKAEKLALKTVGKIDVTNPSGKKQPKAAATPVVETENVVVSAIAPSKEDPKVVVETSNEEKPKVAAKEAPKKMTAV